MTRSPVATLPRPDETRPVVDDFAPARERPPLILPGGGDENSWPAARPPVRPSGLALPLGAFLVALVSLALPPPAHAALAIAAGVAAPAWGFRRLLVAITDLTPALALALGLVSTLASWALAQFLLLETGVPPSRISSLGVLVLLLAVPQFFLPRAAPSRPPSSLRPRPTIALPAVPFPGRHPRALVALECLVAVGTGTALLVHADNIASQGQGPLARYTFFWLGMGLVTAPLILIALRTRTVGIRALALTGLGVGIYLPEFLRSPLAPSVGDAFAHWGAAQLILRTGHVYVPVPLDPVGEYYPGLESLAIVLHEITGLSLYTSGTLALGLLHGLTLVGIAALAQTALKLTDRGGTIAAIVYAASPGFIWFDSWYSYESLAIPLLVWALLVAMRSLAARSYRSLLTYLAFLLLLGCTCVITHHISSYLLILLLAAFAVPALVRPGTGSEYRRIPAAAVVAVALGLGAWAGWWVTDHDIPMLAYLGDPISAGLKAALRLLTGERAGAGQGTVVAAAPTARSLFSGSLLPVYERVCAFLVPVVILALLLRAGLRWRDRLTGPSVAIGALGCAFLVSLALALTTAGSAAAHRSWTFSYIGVASLVGLSLSSSTRGTRRGPTMLRLRQPGAHYVSRRLPIVGTLLLFWLLLVGNFGANVSDYWQFPGPFLVNVDGRTSSPALISAASWMSKHAPPATRILAPVEDSGLFYGYATAVNPSFQLSWQVFFANPAVPPLLLDQIKQQHIDFIVVDDRLASVLPTYLPYFSAYEPLLASYPLPLTDLTKFSHAAWARRVYTTGPVSIFRVEPDRLP